MCNNQTAKFDLTFEAVEKGKTIEYGIEYCTDLFKEETIKRLSNHFINILADITEHPSKKLKDVDILSEKERHQLLVEFNDTAAEFSKDKTIHQIFEEQAEKTPDNIALVFNDETMTYKQLNEKANRLAHTLRANGVGPDDVVGIMTYRSFEMIIGIMAIMKAGGAYMPIDPDYPPERKNYLLSNSCSATLLVQNNTIVVGSYSGYVIDLSKEESYSEDNSNLTVVNTTNNLIYVIYTSGSTGNPKGVMVEHKGVINRICWMLKKYPFNSHSVIMQKTTYSFDVSVWELFSWFFVGASLCLINSGDEKDPGAMISVIEKQGITAMHFVPSMLNAFLDYVESKNCVSKLASLVDVFASGEALTLNQVTRFNALLYKQNDTRLSNLYGPTEATVEVSYFICSPMPQYNTVPIGKPIDNISLYVLDRNLRLLPIGIPGELYIGGIGVARGYLHNPELTSNRFIVSSYSGNDILYKTGDVVRMLSSGEIEYIGREDGQIKIHGFRIELGEIENALLKYKSIEEVIVVAQSFGNDNLKLCAYFRSRQEISTEDLQQFLSRKLPQYMVPSYYILIEKFPLNSNGKIDRAKLPKPQLSNRTGTDKNLPRNSLEREIAEAWASVLGIAAVDIDDNFFDIGGDSLSVVKVVSKINQKIDIVEFFTHPTVRLLAESLSEKKKRTKVLVNLTEEFNPLYPSVICIPYLGGTAFSYRDLSISATEKKSKLNLFCANIPGQEYNSNEKIKPVVSVAKMLAKEIAESIKGEIILYSHCAGCALLYETARLLTAEGKKIKAVFIGGKFVPKTIKLGWVKRPNGYFTRGRVKRHFQRAGLIQDEYNKEYIDFLTSVLKYEEIEFNVYFYDLVSKGITPLKLPMTLIVGDKDPATVCYKARYRSWKRYFYDVDLIVLKNAKHFFINSHPDQLVEIFENA